MGLSLIHISMIGHLLGAAGGVEAVVCVKSIEEGFIHQTVGTKETEEELDLEYCIGGPTRQEVNYACLLYTSRCV